MTRIAGILFIAGILIFSGSLYLLVAGRAGGANSLDKAGMITPLGGISFIAGWVCLILATVKKG